ncbi:fibronectin type III domain-containing protein [Halobellus rubicundus]|uniref:Fibronectin type III domain-containing protein n=1 Tax=Halobellus rubicundus TaxID=2996466 RepID=A0ABD5MDS8_9EURY
MTTETFTSDTDWTIPDSVDTVQIVCRGGAGGDGSTSGGYSTSSAAGGDGGTVTAELDVTSYSTLYIRIGGGGGGPSINFGDAAGGNGGNYASVRAGGTAFTDTKLLAGGGGGGGAAWVSDGDWSPETGSGAGGDGGASPTAGADATTPRLDPTAQGGTADATGSGSGGNGGSVDVAVDGGHDVRAAGGGGGGGYYGGAGGEATQGGPTVGENSGGAGGGGGANYVTGSATNVSQTTGTSTDVAQVEITYTDRVDDLQATGDQGDAVLSWSAVSETDGYRVLRSETSSPGAGSFTQIADLAPGTTSYTDTDAEVGEFYYYYRIETYDSLDSRQSNEASLEVVLADTQIDEARRVAAADIELTWSKADAKSSGGWEIYRATSSGTLGSQVFSTTDPSVSSYTDTVPDSEGSYFYTLRRYTDTAESDSDQIGGPIPDSPSDVAVTSTAPEQLSISWTDNATTEDSYRVFTSRDGGATWTQQSSLPADSESETISGLLNGEEYTIRVDAYTGISAGSTAVGTTEIPDVGQPTLDNGVEDEITATWSDVLNYGSYDVQLRESINPLVVGSTGTETLASDQQSSWVEWEDGGELVIDDGVSLSLTESESVTVPESDTNYTFGGLEDGEKYVVRIRTRTEHRTGAWTDPVAVTTAFPTPANVSVVSTSSTTATVGWDDQADNEDGFRAYVAEKRFGSFGTDQLYETLEANVEQVTLDLRPDTTYRVTIEAFTEDATVDASTTLTTDPPAVSTGAAGRVPAQGPYLEVDHPSNGRTLTPSIVGEVAPPRALMELPTTRVPVAGDKWTDDTWIGADCRLWIDGHRQPVESLVRPVQTPEGAELELRGGEALLKRVEKSVIEQEADSFVRDLLQTEASGIAQTVDDPQSTISSDTFVQGADTDTEWTDRIPAAPFGDSDPRMITPSGELGTDRIAAFQEAESEFTIRSGTSLLAGDPLSHGEGLNISSPGDSVKFNFLSDLDNHLEYPIPASRSEFAVRVGYLGDTHPGFELKVDGTVIETVVADAPIFGNQDTQTLELEWTDIGGSDALGDLAAGDHSLTIEITEAASDGSALTVDCGTIFDSDWTSRTDETLTSGEPVSYPRLHPDAIDVITDDAETIRQVVGGEATSTWNNTLRNQAIAISNDQGANWIEATNSERVEGSFQSGTTNIRARFTLSNYATSSSTEPKYNEGQTVDLYDLYADLDDAPILVDQVFDGKLKTVITEVADFADAFWEVQWDEAAGSQSVEWTFPNLRTAEGDASLINFETSVDETSITEKAVVYGTSQTVRDESVTLQHDTAVALEEQYNQPAEITVRSAPDGATTYERGTDYTYDPQPGEVTALSTGSISDGETVLVDYVTRVRGTYSLPSWDGDETVARTKPVPAATTDRSAETAARILVQQTSEPIHSASVTIEELPVQWGLVEMVSFVELPTDETYEIYSIEQGEGTLQLQLGTRDTVTEVVDDLQSRLEATAAKV